jgi:GNAT superfamily N-acetyltransferase
VSVSVRVCSTATEERRSLAIYNEAWPGQAATPEDVEAWKRVSIATLELLGSVDGVDAGSAAVAVQTPRPHLSTILLTVLPHFRRRGVGRALFEATAAWSREQGVRELETRVEADDEESLAFAERRGFREHSRDVELELDVTSLPAPAIDPPGGIEILLLADHGELARGVYDVAVTALCDVPGNDDWVAPPFDQFTQSHLRGLAIHVAVEGDDVVGYAKLHAYPDGVSAEHGMTAVQRDRRGRGIATALKRAQIAWARANGIARLTASNDQRNAPMRGINEALGYVLRPGRIHLRRPATTP